MDYVFVQNFEPPGFGMESILSDRVMEGPSHLVELGPGVVLEQTQALTVQPPVMSLPLWTTSRC